ncbi:MAG TPA: hypothetical protein VKR23_11950 [Gaiellaceae bacterium]|nr:hypothetical protein [Gaiellaceae bacterium]
MDSAFLRIWDAFDAGEILPACAWCGRVWIDGAWLSPPRASLAAVDPRQTFSHSICDSCTATFNDLAARQRQTARTDPVNQEAVA